MNQLCKLLSLTSNDELFEKITSGLKLKITQWDYFVDWIKVFNNIAPIEIELNILNYLVGKQNIRKEALELLKKYPEVIRAFPTLIAIRQNSIDVLIDNKKFIYNNYSFSKKQLSSQDCEDLVDFLMESGIGERLKDRRIKNLVDYAIGIEVGLDSNGRKNRQRKLMATLVEEFVAETCTELGLNYMSQATSARIKKEWNIDVAVDKSRRQIDFAINKNGQLYFIECNFYGHGGSKLKATASEHIQMNQYWNQQNIKFIWITDGAGWKSTLKPLREYFDRSDYLLNLDLLQKGILKLILR